MSAAMVAAQTQMSFPAYPLDPNPAEQSVSVELDENDTGCRTYHFHTTQTQRDETPRERNVVEQPGDPRLRTGNPLFDGLFALTLDDLHKNAVSQIRDDAYNDGKPIDREVFQTGEKWPYVWTRDTSYAANLSLAIFNPKRTCESIAFKTTGFRDTVTLPPELPEGSLQVVQDTGSGGSWPISTDRVTWALGARSVLNSLYGSEREVFAEYAFRVLQGTVEADRSAAYDPISGLYTGEQSFLDWRTQTYAPWVIDNLSWLGSSKSLSTNVCHYLALETLADLARERKSTTAAERYQSWANALKKAINEFFWLDDEGLYASMTSPGPIARPLHKFDMLGLALVVISGVAPEERARELLARYPHSDFGVPVYFPMQPRVAVYHNRAIWPFVTAYELRAAALVGNVAVANNAIDSLVRGTALNLSNMENLEWLTGRARFDDGPVINSRRQTWSVAGYLSMVSELVFGYHVEADGIEITPFLTNAGLRLMGPGNSATLSGLRYHGRSLSIRLLLPPQNEALGHYAVKHVHLNGRLVSGLVTEDQLDINGSNEFVVEFGALLPGDQRITLVGDTVDPLSHDDAKVFAPGEPGLNALVVDGAVELTLSAPFTGGQEITYLLYRNGQLAAKLEQAGKWSDSMPMGSEARYYSAVAINGHGLRSQPSYPSRLNGSLAQWIPITDRRVSSNVAVTSNEAGYDVPVILHWGAKKDTFSVHNVQIPTQGRYAIYIEYNNHNHAINSGVTNCVKRLSIDNNNETWEGIIQMPNVADLNDRHPLKESTPVVLDLAAGNYTISLKDYFNMSYMQSNALYGGAGGILEPLNTANLAGIRIVMLADTNEASGSD